MKANLAASIRQRLLNRARQDQETFDAVLNRFGRERLLYRIGISEYRDQFLLKGAMLFSLWYDMPHRPTRDMDLLGFGPGELFVLERVDVTPFIGPGLLRVGGCGHAAAPC